MGDIFLLEQVVELAIAEFQVGYSNRQAIKAASLSTRPTL